MKPVCRNIIISILFVTFFTLGMVSAQEKDTPPVPADKISTDTTDRNPGIPDPAVKKEDPADPNRTSEPRVTEKKDDTAGVKAPLATVKKKDDRDEAATPDKKKVQAVTDPVKTVEPEKKHDQQKVEGVHGQDITDDGLLTVSESDIRYMRIPEYSMEKSEPDKKNFVTIPAEKEGVDDSAGEHSEEGLFGLSKGKTDLIARGSLILLILVIFILYRTRSKSSDRKVLRRFPKK